MRCSKQESSLVDKFQKDFLQAILTNDLPSELLDQIKPVGRLKPEDVITVYKNDYVARLQEALGKNYEATWLLMGDDDFLTNGQEYIRTHPSDLRNLTTYGDAFPEALTQQEEFIQDMARFENHFWKLFHSKGRTPNPIDQEQIPSRNFDLEDLYLSHSSIHLHELWLLRESPPEGLELETFEGEEYLALYRSEFRVEVTPINETQFLVLKLLKETRNLNSAFEQMAIPTSQTDWPVIFSILSYF